MGKMRFKVSNVEYGSIAKRERTDKRQNKLLIVVIVLAALNFAWDIFERKEQVKEVYDSALDKAEKIYVDLQK